MSVQLLDKTRKINKLLHNNNSSKVVFNDICEVLTEILDSNVLVVSKKGKVLGKSKCDGVPYIQELIVNEVGKHIDVMLNERLLSILSTKENVNLQTLGFSEEEVKGYQAIITPAEKRRRAVYRSDPGFSGMVRQRLPVLYVGSHGPDGIAEKYGILSHRESF